MQRDVQISYQSIVYVFGGAIPINVPECSMFNYNIRLNADNQKLRSAGLELGKRNPTIRYVVK